MCLFRCTAAEKEALWRFTLPQQNRTSLKRGCKLNRSQCNYRQFVAGGYVSKGKSCDTVSGMSLDRRDATLLPGSSQEETAAGRGHGATTTVLRYTHA